MFGSFAASPFLRLSVFAMATSMGAGQSPETANSIVNDHSTLEGVLERIVFFKGENSFTVARLQAPGKRDLVTIVGALSLPTPGET
jgi:hypothetical protein